MPKDNEFVLDESFDENENAENELNEQNENEDDFEETIIIKPQTDMEKQISKAEETEKNFKMPKDVKYKKDKEYHYTVDKDGTDLDQYYYFFDKGELFETSTFIKYMKLEKGVSAVPANSSYFNKAYHEIIKANCRHTITTYDNDDNDKLLVSKEKKRLVVPFDDLSKEGIIDYMRNVRNQCAGYLLGYEKINAANPTYVKEITEVAPSYKETKRLAWDYDEINKLEHTFEEDEDLYKLAISNLYSEHFRRIYRSVMFNLAVVNGNTVKRFGSGSAESESINLKKAVDSYLNLKDIHRNRPWYYGFIHPVENWYEKSWLTDFKNEMMEAGENNGYEEELAELLDTKGDSSAANYDAINEKLNQLLPRESVSERSNDVSVLDKTKTEISLEMTEEKETEKEKIEIKEEEIEHSVIAPQSDVKDENHPNQVDGFGMGEKTVYLSDDEYNRIHNDVVEHEPKF